jgi:glucose-6-phosphate 1-dehydrogenase
LTFKVLENFREEVIRPSFPGWEPQRSILRDSMIETFIRQKITDSTAWFNKVPSYQRSGTNPEEKIRFLDQICEIVEKISSP